MKKEIYPIIGMHCASCKSLIEGSVGELKGVKVAQVNFASEKLNVEYDERVTSVDEIRNAVGSVGSYKLIGNEHDNVEDSNSQMSMPGHDHAAMLKEEEYNQVKRNVVWSGLGSLPFLVFMIWMLVFKGSPMDLFGEISFTGGYSISLFYLIQFLLATPILFVSGRSIFQSALTALKVPTANMDTLIAVGTFTAWSFSSFVTFFPSIFSGLKDKPEVFFEASVFIIFFILKMYSL